ncbi:hypothetical protein AF72_10825 [Xylella taiwanensis]|uniref:Uncharacterized protein n=1 Tax=Xylella taiwanensis TaxID=1444770 RepID=Z9JHF3_9GAMM|nr:hypothetical protein AF72_10825 [Xylella taiwanensis]
MLWDVLLTEVAVQLTQCEKNHQELLARRC